MNIEWVYPPKPKKRAQLTMTREELELLVETVRLGLETNKLEDGDADAVTDLLVQMGYPL